MYARFGSWKSRAPAIILPLVAFVLANLVLLTSARASGASYADPSTWTHGDSGQYLEIADRGYEFFSCARLQGYSPADWCGNTGWFPGYPLLLRSLSLIGLGGPVGGLILASLFYLGSLYVLWFGLLKAQISPSNVLALLMSAFFFGSVYYRAVFPVSAEIFFILLFVFFLARDRWLAAGISGAAAAFFYSTGFLLAGVTVIWLALARRDLEPRCRLVAGVQAAGLTVAGFLAVLGVQWISTGVWGAFFKVQAKYGYGVFPPTKRLLASVVPVLRDGLSVEEIPNLQTAIVAVAVVILVTGSGLVWRRVTPMERWVVIATLIFWLFPLMLGGVLSLYRSEALLLPSTLLLRHIPMPLQLALVAAAIALAYPMSMLFYENVLI